MMSNETSFTTKNNSGALFKNNNKTTETQPDFKGNCRINEEDYYISAWRNKSSKGVDYLKLSFTLKSSINQQQNTNTSTNAASKNNFNSNFSNNIFDDDIPF